MNLTRNESKTLKALRNQEPISLDEIKDVIAIGRGPLEQAARSLAEKGLVDLEETTNTIYDLTEEGQEYLENGLPERNAYRFIEEKGQAEIEKVRDEISGFKIAIGHMRKKNWVEINNGVIEPLEAPESPEERALQTIQDGDEPSEDDAEALVNRGLAKRRDERALTVEVTEEGMHLIENGITMESGVKQLTHEMLSEGSWRDKNLSPYNVEADTAPRYAGKTHILRQLADRVKEVFTSMGFKEMQGPHVDAEFYINDCLFMPQDHPARTHWDKFLIDNPSHINELPEELVEDVREVHREGVDDGEGYTSEWREMIARLLNLRGHTTSLSMRYISEGVEPPVKYFSVDKVYRNDTIDPTHLLEFFQIEGWVMARDLSARDLMGTFVEFYSRFGIEDLEFKPHYNPYTEPSFEIFGTHPETGEVIEIGNSGMFRREVLDPLGVDRDVEVIAWGLALERLLMLIYGFEDIRDVHGTLCDIELLREVPELWR